MPIFRLPKLETQATFSDRMFFFYQLSVVLKKFHIVVSFSRTMRFHYVRLVCKHPDVV